MQNTDNRIGVDMQTELFEKNAVILFYDEVQRMLYHDALSANGYSVKDMKSAHELSNAITNETDMIMLDLDNTDYNSIMHISHTLKDKNKKAIFVGLSSNIENMPSFADSIEIEYISKPTSIVHILEVLSNAFNKLLKPNGEHECNHHL